MRMMFRAACAALALLSGAAMAATPRSAHAMFMQRGGATAGALAPRAAGRGAVRHASTNHAGALAKTTAAKAKASATLATERLQMLSLINAERAQAGDHPLALDSALDDIAQARSQDMIDRHYFSHYIPGGGMVFDILDRDHVPYEMAGENIALNNYIDFYPLDETIQRTNTDLMNSPEHRANLLEPKYTHIGLGVAFEQGTGKLILTEVFVQP